MKRQRPGRLTDLSAECDLLDSGAVALGAFLVCHISADLGTALDADLQIPL